MKRLFKLFTLLAMFVGFASCEELTEDGTILGFSGFNTSDLSQTISSEGKSILFSFIADDEWGASVVYDDQTGWISIDPEYGDSLVITNMTILVSENTDNEERTAKVKIVAGENQVEVKITQSGVGSSSDDGVYDDSTLDLSQFLVTKLTIYDVDEGEFDDEETYEIEYDSEYRISKVVYDMGMISGYNYRKIWNYTYSSDKITELIEYDYGPADAQDDRTYTYNLNASGFIASYTADSRSGNYTYEDGYLTKYTYTNDWYSDYFTNTFNLTWQDGSLTSISGTVMGNSAMNTDGEFFYEEEDINSTFTYNFCPNITFPVNFDINSLIAQSEVSYEVFSDMSPFLAATGYFGAMTSKYLLIVDNDISGSDVYEYTYDYNDDGTPSQVTIMCDGEDDDYIVCKFTPEFNL